MGVTTTNVDCNIIYYLVEEHYKMGVTKTTTLDKTQQEYSVEEHYQEIQTTNDPTHFYFEKDVEELYEQNTNG